MLERTCTSSQETFDCLFSLGSPFSNFMYVGCQTKAKPYYQCHCFSYRGHNCLSFIMENESEHAASMSQDGPRDNGDQSAPLYNPLPLHAGYGQSLGHSVVPDLMKIYESLTQSKTPQSQQEQARAERQHQHPSIPVPQPPHQMYQNASQFYPPAPAAAPYPFMQVHPQQYSYASIQPSLDLSVPQNAQPDFEDSKHVSSSGRALRKRSVDKIEDDRSSSDGSSSRSRKKKKSDGRWSKRFTWPDELHRDFVSAIFDVGLKHASPSALLEHMPEHDQVTSERVKSHLQKYRLHRVKSKKEFMSCYDASLNNFQTSGVNTRSLGSGEMAAHLTYCTMNEPEEPEEQPVAVHQQQGALQDIAHEMTGTSRGGALILPKLTEAEKQSPIGASMGYMMGLFFALRQQLMANRAAAASSEGANASTVNNQVPFVSYPNSAAGAEHVGEHHDQNVDSCPPPSHSIGLPQQQSSYHDKPTAAAASKAHAASASRTKLEESNLMKREMQSQMAFQNKMRALKQQELNKSKTPNNGTDHHHGHTTADLGDDNHGRIKQSEEALEDAAEDDDGRFQEAGEGGEAGNGHTPERAARARHRGLSVGASEDFWVNDEQLFEFLMDS